MMRRSSLRRVVALAVLVGAAAPAVASVIIAWVFALPQQPVPGVFLSASPLEVQSRFDDIGVVVALIYGPLSAVLIARRPHPVALLLAIHAVGSGIAAFGVQWGLLGQQIPGLPVWGFLAHAAGWGYIPGTVMTTVVPLLLIRGRGPLRRVLIIAATTFAIVGTFVAFTQQGEGAPPNPFAIPSPAYQAATALIYGIAVLAALGVSAVTAAIILRRWIVTTPDERRGLGWLVTGHIFLTLSYAALVIPADDSIPSWVWDFGMIAPVVGQIFYPAAVLVMALGQRVWGIDVAVNRVLVWAILVVIAIVGYLLLVSAITSLGGGDARSVGIVAAAIVALALLPLRGWLQNRIDRLVYSGGKDPRELVRGLGERVGELESGREGLRGLADALRAALRLGSVTVRSNDPVGPSASVGHPVGPVRSIELRAGPAVLGFIDVTAQRGERIGRRTIRSLEELSGVVAAALQLVTASDELELARDEVLAVRQEERRQIRRELHDGIGPALAGIGFGLAGVANMAAEHPDEAAALLRRLTNDLRERLVAVRELARAMHPSPDLDDLDARLEGLARDFSGAGPAVTVNTPASAALDPAARDATYFIAAEAVYNAVRHADARSIHIDLVAGDSGTRLSIADDGRGFEPSNAIGVGMTSMRERAHAVGARLGVRSRPDSGTLITVDFEGEPA